MLRGLTTVTYLADDVAAAVDWYPGLLGAGAVLLPPGRGQARLRRVPHRRLPARARHPRPPVRAARPPDEVGGAVVYWHVDDVKPASGGCCPWVRPRTKQPIERGPGFVTASVVDPFGNLLGVMYNQHYVDVLASRPGA